MGTEVDLADVQGNILRSYGSAFGFVRHLVLRVLDPTRARAALGDMVTGDRSGPEVTSAEQALQRQAFGWCLNLGITHRGLAALGVPSAVLDSFPSEFRTGMIARAGWLGDIGAGAPEHWIAGLGDAEQAHVIVTVHGRTAGDVEAIADAVLAAQDGQAFNGGPDNTLDGAIFTGPAKGRVHFGYLDGLSNVRFEGVHEPRDETQGRLAPVGAVLLGYPSPIPHVSWSGPRPDQLRINGSFNAFRVLGQDVAAFGDFLRRAAAQTGTTEELVAAKLCGRWRNGVPLVVAPTEAEAQREAAGNDKLNNPPANVFGFADDPDGIKCPIGSHIRRCNPRDALLVQRGTNGYRTVVRRGMPYGPVYESGDDGVDDVPRGLLGNFICADLGAQFESLQMSWINLGLQDPTITGTNDPIVGANDPATADFGWPTVAADGTAGRVEAGPLSRFVTTRGGAYCFLPSLTAIRWIATQG